MAKIDNKVELDNKVERVPAKTDLTVRSVLTALDIIDCFMDDDELGVSEIGRRLGIPKSTVYRLLLTLCHRGLIARTPETNKYCLGLRAFEIGQMAVTRHKLRQITLPFLDDIRRRTGTTVQLSMPDGVDVLVIERLFSAPRLEFVFPPGRRTPCHATSSGKALAAHNDLFAEARRRAGFPQLTARTTCNVVEFDRGLALARQRGYALMFDEVLPGIASVGAPIFDSTGRAIAALSLIDASPNVHRNVERFGTIALEAVRKMSPKVICPTMDE